MTCKLFVIFVLTVVFGVSCGHDDKLKQGNKTIAKVEKFRSEKGRLPNNLSEIGIVETESGPIFYKKVSETKYSVSFGKELGESAAYDSETKKWSNL